MNIQIEINTIKPTQYVPKEKTMIAQITDAIERKQYALQRLLYHWYFLKISCQSLFAAFLQRSYSSFKVKLHPLIFPQATYIQQLWQWMISVKFVAGSFLTACPMSQAKSKKAIGFLQILQVPIIYESSLKQRTKLLTLRHIVSRKQFESRFLKVMIRNVRVIKSSIKLIASNEESSYIRIQFPLQKLLSALCLTITGGSSIFIIYPLFYISNAISVQIFCILCVMIYINSHFENNHPQNLIMNQAKQIITTNFFNIFQKTFNNLFHKQDNHDSLLLFAIMHVIWKRMFIAIIYNQIYQMIERAQSFSKGGKVIERVMEIEKYKIDRDKLNKILSSKSSKLAQFKQQTSEPLQISGFDKVPGREKLNSFQIHKTKDAYVSIDYDNKKDVVLAKSTRTVFNKEQDKRLSQLFKRPQYSNEEDEACNKHQQTNNEHIKTPNDLHSGRKTFHSLNFDKQTSRPFDETLRKMSIQVEQQNLFTRSNSVGAISHKTITQQKNPMLKLNKVHSFASYTRRDFLSEKNVQGAPQVSGIDCFKINPQKFKSHWKVVGAPKFQRMTEKHLSRYDRDGPHWFTQLAYNVKDNKKSVKSHLDFETQTLRKQNLVKSSYPIRLAI